jgi:DNA-binding NtrC family response regulator
VSNVYTEKASDRSGVGKVNCCCEKELVQMKRNSYGFDPSCDDQIVHSSQSCMNQVMGDDDLLGADLLSPRVLRAAPEEDEAELQMLDDLDGSLKQRVESLEARILKETLIRHRWNKSQAAKELGLSRVGLRSKLERYGLEKIEQLRDEDDIIA